MKLRLVALPFALVAACSGDEGVPIDASPIDCTALCGLEDAPTDSPPPVDAPIDAPPPIDAPSSVQVIANCTGVQNPAVTVSAATGAYVPQNPTLQVNQVLRFEPGSSIHDMAAVNGEFSTPLGQITCLRFTAPGTFPVHCSIHGFTGSVTVTN